MWPSNIGNKLGGDMSKNNSSTIDDKNKNDEHSRESIHLHHSPDKPSIICKNNVDLSGSSDSEMSNTHYKDDSEKFNISSKLTIKVILKTILALVIVVLLFFLLMLIVAPIANTMYVWCVKHIVPNRFGGGSASTIDYDIINGAFRDVISSFLSTGFSFYVAMKFLPDAKYKIVFLLFVVILTIFFALQIYVGYLNSDVFMSIIAASVIYIPSVIAAKFTINEQ